MCRWTRHRREMNSESVLKYYGGFCVELFFDEYLGVHTHRQFQHMHFFQHQRTESI